MKFHLGLLLACLPSLANAKLGQTARRASDYAGISRYSMGWPKTFWILPSEADPKLPLSICQGDCDSDSDCDEGLACFQRNANEAIPGCRGGLDDDSAHDYCVPQVWLPLLPVEEAHSFPLGQCQGESNCQQRVL
eukprot:scaffold12540_cov105-Cylindrotheca_fusiformis.AAC.5